MTDQIKLFQKQIEELIQQQDLAKKPEELYQPIAYTLNQGGKRLRPVLTLLACELFGGKAEDVLYPALAVEVFHNFTLVHDDIMDKAPLRRGQETVYKKWNADIAILSGDTMFALAYQLALKTRPEFVSDILHVFSKAAIEVCEGQQLDLNFETQENVSIEDYLDMIRLKTAVLLGTALEIGAIVGGANASQMRSVYRFGINLGIAFQLKDDLLDVYGNQEKFGKKSGGDIATNKKTYLYLKALELSDEHQYRTLKQLYNGQSSDENAKIKAVKSIFDSLNIKNQVENIMQGYYENAVNDLHETGIDPEKLRNLLGFAQALYRRNY